MSGTSLVVTVVEQNYLQCHVACRGIHESRADPYAEIRAQDRSMEPWSNPVRNVTWLSWMEQIRAYQNQELETSEIFQLLAILWNFPTQE